MGITRERKVLCGLGAVAVAGLMFDKAFLGPADASVDPGSAQQAVIAAPATGVAARLEGGVRDAMWKMLEQHARDTSPDMNFGPNPAWIPAALVSMAAVPEVPQPGSEPAQNNMSGILPGLTATPALSLVMAAREGGIAVIYGHTMQVGQMHPGGFVITAIHARSVTITKDGFSATLTLPSPGN